jgi:hypothetical protein
MGSGQGFATDGKGGRPLFAVAAAGWLIAAAMVLYGSVGWAGRLGGRAGGGRRG